MRIILNVILIVINIVCMNAQSVESSSLGGDLQKYRGAYFRLKENITSGFEYSFYGDSKQCLSDNNSKIIYPDPTNSIKTNKDSLINRVFIVEKIIDMYGNDFTGSSYLDKPVFILRDTSNDQKIYYRYNKKNVPNFPFKIKLDEKVICSKIERMVDDFTGEINLNSPISNNYRLSSMIIYKNINKNKSNYYLGLRTTGSTVVVDGTGATMLFTDGTKLTKPVKIDVEADKDGFEYSVFITLTQADLATLSTKQIKKFRLYIFDEEASQSDGDEFRIFVKCIKSAK